MSGEELRGSRSGFDPAASAGLFVGVSLFEDERIASVPFAVDDAVDLAHRFVVDLGLVGPLRATLLLSGEPRKPESAERLARLLERGVVRRGAHLGDVYDALDELAGRTGPRGLAVLTLATHGLSDQGGDFFLAADSRRRRQLEMGVRVPLVFDEMARAIEGLDAGRALVLLDACRERLTRGRRAGAEPPMAQTFAEAIGHAHGVAVLAGATLGGFAYDDDERRNGVFTAAVLDGLDGRARPGPDGWITVRTLADFVQESVAAWVRRHRPEDADSSRGIERRIEATAEGLPLAPHPETTRERERYRERRDKALARLRENLGDVLDGSHWNQVRALLPATEPSPAAERLLDQVEALNGTEFAQRGLRDVLRDLAKGESSQAAGEVIRRATAQEAARGEVDGGGKLARRKWLTAAASMALVAVTAPFWWWWATHDRQPAETIEPEQSMMLEEPASPLESEPAHPAAGATWVAPAGIRFHFVPSGTYEIGSPAGEPGRDSDETQHPVALTRGVWLAETDLTQSQWTHLIGGERPWRFQNCGPGCPVENVSWFTAVEFANRLSNREKLAACYRLSGCTGALGEETCKEASFIGAGCPGYRLSTEAEWEIAARAVLPGSAVSHPIYTGRLTLRGDRAGAELRPIAWYRGNSAVSYAGGFDCSARTEIRHRPSPCGPHPVAEKKPNAWGFRDILGDVWEWTGDWYANYPTYAEPDSVGPSEGTDRVIRGGSWHSFAPCVRAAFRDRDAPSGRFGNVGFRLARSQASHARG